MSSVRFVRWARGAPQAAAAGPGGLLTVPLPVPYTLPPTPYGPSDKPWAVDVAWLGVDIRGASRDSPRGCLYGLLDSQDWMEPPEGERGTGCVGAGWGHGCREGV